MSEAIFYLVKNVLSKENRKYSDIRFTVMPTPITKKIWKIEMHRKRKR